jgi:hypothetical protein
LGDNGIVGIWDAPPQRACGFAHKAYVAGQSTRTIAIIRTAVCALPSLRRHRTRADEGPSVPEWSFVSDRRELPCAWMAGFAASIAWRGRDLLAFLLGD